MDTSSSSSSGLASPNESRVGHWYSEPAITKFSAEWVNKFAASSLSAWSRAADEMDLYLFNQNQWAAYLEMKQNAPSRFIGFSNFINGRHVGFDTGVATLVWERSEIAKQRKWERDRDTVSELLALGARQVTISFQSALSKGNVAELTSQPIAMRIEAIVEFAAWMSHQVPTDKIRYALIDAYPARNMINRSEWRAAYTLLRDKMHAQGTELSFIIQDYPAQMVLGENKGSVEELIEELHFIKEELGLTAAWWLSSNGADDNVSRQLILDAAREIKAHQFSSVVDAILLGDFKGTLPDDIPDTIDGKAPFTATEVFLEVNQIFQ